MKIQNRQQILIVAAVLVLTIAVLWVYLSVFKTLKSESEKPILTPQEIRTIDPTLDETVFEELKNQKNK